MTMPRKLRLQICGVVLLSMVGYGACGPLAAAPVREAASLSLPSLDQARGIPAGVVALEVKGVHAPGDAGAPLQLRRVRASGPRQPWEYEIQGQRWQLQNSTVTPQMVGYLAGADAITAIANAGAYCNARQGPGCVILLPRGRYLIDVPARRAKALIQTTDWEIDFAPGAKIVSGPHQQDANLKIFDGPKGMDQAHRLVIRNANIDTSGGDPRWITPGNVALEIAGQKRVDILNPRLYGGRDSSAASDVGLAITGVVDGRIAGGTIQGYRNTAIYPEGYNLSNNMPENSTFTIQGTCFLHNGQAVAAKRRLKLLIIRNLCADWNDRGVGTYEAGGPGDYAHATEPPARRVVIDGGRISHTATRAIELRGGTTALISNLDIVDTGRAGDGRTPMEPCDAVQLIGARDVRFSNVRIRFQDWKDHNCAAIVSSNETVLGKPFVSAGHANIGPLSIQGYAYGLYEAPGVGPTRLRGVKMTGVAKEAKTTNPQSQLARAAQ